MLVISILFHYHWWTDKVKEMESFYKDLGFQVVLRLGKLNGEMQAFHPPLEWEDFGEKEIAFRIIEMRKGKTNLTFGHGKRDMFDHLGLLVNVAEYKAILKRVALLGWRVSEGERRTFISTPWKFRIELQTRKEVIQEEEEMIIQSMQIQAPFKESPVHLAKLLNIEVIKETRNEVIIGNRDWNLVFTRQDNVRLETITFKGSSPLFITDPMNTTLM
ncbi:hypothetical protein HNQ94_001825 [Salirhabdus euzebyi]|uniref:Glyoxalase-like domain-containing protein n=1 Tax=Salirhabdus euzebyi TaxID=394506 RepID=A0A841Q4S1_9BACI|nr:hypothetical protein [Salirhabdus euzebyi]MBB6453377.1 hypothetical protein [Salirhabdus euzebyi]